MWSFLKKLFKKKEKRKEWLEGLFDNIEYIKNLEYIVPFEILDLKTGGFLVKTKGLFGYVPIRYMPWQYEKMENWVAIMPSLRQCVFYGYVYRTDDSEDGKSKRVYVKADSLFLNKAHLKREEEYVGIVIQKIEYGVFVDIGHHFKWRCGSFVGFVHQSKFPNHETFINCEMGQVVTVNIIDNTEKGLSFKDTKYVDLHEKYEGKTVPVTVYKDEKNGLELKVDDRYKAKMPLWVTLYRQDLLLVRKALQLVPNGAVVQGEVLEIKQDNTIIVKMSSQNDILGKAELHIQELKAYCGKTVRVRIIKKGYNEVSYLVDDKYRAFLPLNESVYRQDLKAVTRLLNNCMDGDIIDCEVTYVDYLTELFTLHYLDVGNLNEYIGQTVKVRVYRNDNDILTFWVKNTCKADMPITESIYGDDFDVVNKVLDIVSDGEQIECEVLDVHDNTLIVKLLMHNEIVKKIVTYPKNKEEYVGKMVKVNVSLSQDGGLDFMVENTYQAIMPIKKYDYGANVDLLCHAIKFWLSTKEIDCYVLSYDKVANVFVLKWIPKDRKWSGIDWSAVVVSYLRRIVFVYVYLNNDKKPVFFVDNKYWAVMESEKSETDKLRNSLVDGEIIHCKVISYNQRGSYFTINWIKTGISHAKKSSTEPSLEKMTYAQLLKKNPNS